MGKLKLKLFLIFSLITLIVSVILPIFGFGNQRVGALLPGPNPNPVNEIDNSFKTLQSDQFQWADSINIGDVSQNNAMFYKVSGDINSTPRFYVFTGIPKDLSTACQVDQYTTAPKQISYSPGESPNDNGAGGAPYDNASMTALAGGGNNVLAYIDFRDQIDLKSNPKGNLWTFLPNKTTGSCKAVFVKYVTPIVADAGSQYRWQGYNEIVPNYTDSMTDDSTARNTLKGQDFTIVCPDNATNCNGDGSHTYDENKIKTMGGNANANSIIYADTNDQNCPSLIILQSSDGTKGTLYEYSYDTNNKCSSGINGTPHSHGRPGGSTTPRLLTSATPITIADAGLFDLTKAKDPDSGSTFQDKNPSGGKAGTCEGANGVFGWIICGITEAADNIIGFFETQVTGLLKIDPRLYGETNNAGTSNKTNNLYTAWSAIRIIATILLIGIALFMIISQMFNIEAMSAYAIKKMAPRIVIAVILIQLSWFIFTSLIAITNLIGDGAKDLLMAPFGGGNNINNITSILHQYYINHPVAGVTWQVGTTGVVTVFGLGMLLMTGLGAYIGMLLGGFAIALIIAIAGVLFLLITRVVIVIALLVISPLALIAWILPNTQNMWQQWWKLFSRMLILYPMIVVLFTIGKIVAWLAANMK